MKKHKIKSLNEGLPEFFLEDLEQRLETDPLNVGALVSLNEPSTQSGSEWCLIHCSKNFSCNEYKG